MEIAYSAGRERNEEKKHRMAATTAAEKARWREMDSAAVVCFGFGLYSISWHQYWSHSSQCASCIPFAIVWFLLICSKHSSNSPSLSLSVPFIPFTINLSRNDFIFFFCFFFFWNFFFLSLFLIHSFHANRLVCVRACDVQQTRKPNWSMVRRRRNSKQTLSVLVLAVHRRKYHRTNINRIRHNLVVANSHNNSSNIARADQILWTSN